jgi:integrase
MTQRKSLTDANVIALEVRSQKYEVWDAGPRAVPGFCVRVEGSGRKTFYFRYSMRGLFWFRIGPVAMGAAEARTEAKKLLGDVARGINPHRERMTRRVGLTFEQLQKRHVEEHAKKHNKSWKQGDYLIRAYAMRKLGRLKASEITRADVRQLFGSITSPTAANQVKAALSSVFSFGIQMEIVANNPCRGIRDNPVRSRDRILAPEEIVQFWAACDEIHPVKAAALKTILLVGARPGEVCNMRMEDIRGEWWEQPGEPAAGWPGTKNKRTHFVWLTSEVRELISRFADNGVAFPNERGKPFKNLDEVMREISALCLFSPTVEPRDLRRTFGSMVAKLRFGRDSMDRLLNHFKQSSVTNTYDRNPYADENKLIWGRVGAEIIRIAEGISTPTNTLITAIHRRGHY